MKLAALKIPSKSRYCPHCGEAISSSRMSEKQQLEAINRYIEGETLYGLAVRFKRDVTTIRRLMARNGIRKRAPKITNN